MLASLAVVAMILSSPGALHASATVRACSTSGLVVWLDTQGDGAAGSTYFKLKFTNQSGRTCTLKGYPGVSGIALSGHQLGSPATRSHATAARAVRLVNGGTVAATLRIVQAGNFPAHACRVVSASGLRVYPPGQTAARIVPFPFPACSQAGPAYLQVEAIA
ncbi:MAG TPA: DUF4232 domain-containing protein [Gaiellaceae bacterium]|jgi:hypothetical protein